MKIELSDGSVMICGILGKDAEYKQVGYKNSSLTKFSIKVGERPPVQQGEKAQAIWVNVQCWHSVARATQNLQKLDTALVIGRIEKRPYTAKDGTEKTDVHVNAEFVIAMTNKPVAAQTVNSASIPDTLDGFEELLDDDGVPF